jgi:hypothetical protein
VDNIAVGVGIWHKPEVDFMSAPSPAPEGAFSSEGRKAIGALDEPPPAVIPIKKPAPSRLAGCGLTVLVAALVAAVVATLISVGVNLLMAKLGGGQGDRLVQEGKVIVGVQGEQQVFYPIPYAAPPNLQLGAGPADMHSVKITEQKPDHFKVMPVGGINAPREYRWRAEGIRARH